MLWYGDCSIEDASARGPALYREMALRAQGKSTVRQDRPPADDRSAA
jgi:hypothetical protein